MLFCQVDLELIFKSKQKNALKGQAVGCMYKGEDPYFLLT